MNDAQTMALPIDSDQEFGPLNLLIVLVKHKRLLIGLPLAVAILVGLITLFIPNQYRATTRLLPPQQAQSGASALLAQLGSVAGAAAGSVGVKSPSDLYIGMVKSRTVADKVIAKLDLKRAFDTQSSEAARAILERSTTVASGKDGLISITFVDEDQKLVAPVANAYVFELQMLTKTLALTEASQRRLFFETQLEISKDNLAAAEGTLKQALETRGVINVESESRAMAEIVARLRAQISAKEIELSSLKAFVTNDNPEFIRAQQELNSLRAEMSKLENGRSPGAVTGAGAASRVGLENVKVLREVKYHQMLYELLAKQYELARLDEAKDSAIIQVLDVAIEPERKSGPRRTLYIVFSALVAFFFAAVISVIVEAKRKALGNTAFATQWATLISHLPFQRARR